jgi:hypothetical protein
VTQALFEQARGALPVINDSSKFNDWVALPPAISADRTSVRQQRLWQCAVRARAGTAVRVVVYAMDQSRAKPILEAIRRGIVTHLVTEMGLAAAPSAVYALLESESYTWRWVFRSSS